MTKFPGGGLEYGEGPIECLKRECYEEMGLEINVTGHFYTTDFFQEALFFDHTQLISIYYTFDLPKSPPLLTSQKSFPFEPKEGNQSFRWMPLDLLSAEALTFPIDQKVAKMIKGGL
jgi:8-oxo-dGTP pyrophosphatase MutT (NUDIX family)